MNANEMTYMISPSSLGEKRVICIENLIWGLKVDKVGLLSVNVAQKFRKASKEELTRGCTSRIDPGAQGLTFRLAILRER
jgi:hypothetical protein